MDMKLFDCTQADRTKIDFTGTCKKAERCSSAEMHQRLWYWLSIHPECDKEAFFTTMSITIVPESHCYACAVTDYCSMCPIKWTNNSEGCNANASPYHKWVHTENLKQKAEYAKQIAELPWKEKQDGI